MEGILEPGNKLDIDQFAAAMRVSRMPVREAVKRLQVEGLVDITPHKEATVAAVTKEQIADVFLVRTVLEGLAAREATQRIEAKGLTKLWKLFKEMEKMVEEGNAKAQLGKNREFHGVIHKVAGNRVLQSFASHLFDSIERYRLGFISTHRRPEEILVEHRQLIEAIGAHDPDRAEKLMRWHIEKTGQIMLGYTNGITEKEKSQEKSGQI